MGLQEATKVEMSIYIGSEEKEVLIEIMSLCIFLNNKEKRQFWKDVTAAARCTHIDAITEDEFENAFLKAKSILHQRGDEVFKGSKTRNAMHTMRYVRGMRRNGSWR